MRFLSSVTLLLSMVVLGACAAGDSAAIDAGVTPDSGMSDATLDATSDAGQDMQVVLDATSDAPVDGGIDAGPNCLELGHLAGERYIVGDECNYCDCNADGSSTCTARVCGETGMECEYEGVTHPYATRFDTTDGCNECVCGPSGLACTRRECAPEIEESAILLENSNAPCGGFSDFSAAAMVAGLPTDDFTAPFLYERDRDAELYPETLPDTTMRFRIVHYQFEAAVCRIPMPGQEAIDLPVYIEFTTEDGKFNEGFHAYLRRDRTSMVDWYNFAVGIGRGELHGTYSPGCFDDRGFSLGVNIYGDGTAEGAIHKTCEADISLTVGAFNYAP